MTPRKNLALKIALLRAGLSQQDAAGCVHLNVWRLSRIVNGREAPSPRVRAALAKLLRVPAHELFPVRPAAPERPAA